MRGSKFVNCNRVMSLTVSADKIKNDTEFFTSQCRSYLTSCLHLSKCPCFVHVPLVPQAV